MRRARSIDDFVRDPVGAFQAGRTHVVWCHSPTLVGTVHWGRPTDADARALVRRLDLCLHPALAHGFDVVQDSRATESFDAGAFQVLSRYVRERLPAWSRNIRRHAVLVPSGMVAATVAGLIPLVGPSHPLRFFGAEDEALAWLRRRELPSVLAEVAAIADEARGTVPLVRSLRHRLDGALGDATIASLARALGVSSRSLQRELARNGTSFRLELTRARVRAASQLLESSDDKIEAIARRVGWGSSSQMSAVFRRELGETPAQYRARRREAGWTGG